MKSDLTPLMDKPLWPLSSYAPAKHEPILLGGLDESPEELRVRASTAKQAGNFNEYVSHLLQGYISSPNQVHHLDIV
jgi:nucleoporin NUP42